MNEVNSICVKYNGEELATIQVTPGMDLNEVLSKIDTVLKDYMDSQALSNLDLGCIDIDPLDLTRSTLDQALIEEICNINQTLTGISQSLSDLPNLVLGVTVDIDFRELLGTNNDCVPSVPQTLRQVLSMYATEIQNLKKKDYTENTCDESCGNIVSVSGSFVECQVLPDVDGDFDSQDVLDIDYYATYPWFQ
jgi:hypothetical protein